MAGSGKSEVAKIFEGLGAYVIDADDIARAVADDPEVLTQLRFSLGEDRWQSVLDSSGNLDRKALRKLISEDAQAQQLLNSITHPKIASEIASRLVKASEAGIKIAVVEAALIFGSGFESMFDRIVLVSSPVEKCQLRIANRDRVSLDDAGKLLKAQSKTLRLALHGADLVIENSGSIDDLRKEAVSIWKELECLAMDEGC